MRTFVVCKCCGEVVETENVVTHYAKHDYGSPKYQGFEDGEHKAFNVIVKVEWQANE